VELGTPQQAEAPAVEPSALDTVVPPSEGEEIVPTAEQSEQAEQAADIDLAESEPGRRERQRPLHGNALGTLIERQFAAPGSPCRSYSDLERRSGISREALSRYVTARADRRRSPTIDTLVAIADALHLSLDAICRAAAASVKGFPLPEEEVRRAREEVLSPLVSGLSADQFNAVAELLRLMRPAGG
jgi:transcriptional regulator with XRE-family HTH domain